jgi:predicted ATPase/class 3 adenylate cyclase
VPTEPEAHHLRVRHDLPTGSVTFLFTDIEGSTRLLEELGEEGYVDALAEHRRALRDAFSAYGGIEVDTQGDAFLFVFADPGDALAASAEGQEALSSGPVTVRMGLHTGKPRLTGEGYAGRELHRAARIASCGHGGQVLVSSATSALVDRELTELGEHRLKDFSEPVALFQLGSERFPPLKTLSNTNLPRPASSFVGRDREIEEVTELLENGTRLLTLSGPGGSGKTRLAIEAAAELVPAFKAGVFWVPLATIRDPALVAHTIAQTLGAKESLAEHIHERELLLLLDNLEQVIEAAPELGSLLEACPNLKLLVTSRELLRIKGEVEYAVPPLSDQEAVELFFERAQTEPDETIEELCHRLDNLPLAIELAAARTSVLSPKQILERLPKRLDLLKGGRDAEARQQTLRAAIEWSYDLLSAEEQQLFNRLSVFAGGCTLEAAEEVCEADHDLLQSLADKSLLRHSDERFWMLETIREYASERLEASGEAEELRRRHAGHFIALAEEAEPHLRGSPGKWLARVKQEHDNVRAALDRLDASRETELVLRLAGAMWRFWYFRGHLTEGQRRLESALHLGNRPTPHRARALIGAAVMALNRQDGRTAKLRAEEALALHSDLGDAWGVAYAQFLLGHVVDEPTKAQRLYEQSRRAFLELGDEHSALLATRNLAWRYEELGDFDHARALHEDNLRRARETANERIEASTLGMLSDYARKEGRTRDALSMLRESLRIHRDVGDLLDTAVDACRFAAALAADGRAETAACLLSSIEADGERIGGRRSMVAEMNDETLTAIQAALDEAAFAEAWRQGEELTIDEAVALALAEVAADA